MAAKLLFLTCCLAATANAQMPSTAAQLPDASAPPDVSISTPLITLVAVGDIRLDGPVGALIRAKGFDAPTAAVRQALRADIVFGNLECPLTERGEKFPKTWNFRAPPENLQALKAAGFNLLNLANNHVADYGTVGLLDTLSTLDAQGLPHIGAGRNLEEALKPVIVSTQGLRIGFLGITSTFPEEAWAGKNRPGVAYSDYGRVQDHVRKARQECDLLIVSFHGGTERAEEPNEIQISATRAAVDAGADLVIGHHPHVIQPVEIYKGRFILHSIGNFLFVSPTPSTRWSVIARATLSGQGVESIAFTPIDTWDGPVRPAGPDGFEAVRKALNLQGALDQSPRLRMETGLPPPRK